MMQVGSASTRIRLDFGILQSIPDDLYEAAYIDGCQQFVKKFHHPFPNDYVRLQL